MSEPTFVSQSIKFSETKAELFKALNKAQSQVETVKKDATNPHFKSKYADLASVWSAAKGPFTSNGLFVVQTPLECIDVAVVETLIGHSSGEWMSVTTTFKMVKNDPQGAGSATTYARRYVLMGIAGIAPEDDDGNAASQPTQTFQKKPQSPIKPQARQITPDQMKEIKDLVKHSGLQKEQITALSKEHLGIEDARKLTFDAAEKLKSLIVEKMNEQSEFNQLPARL